MGTISIFLETFEQMRTIWPKIWGNIFFKPGFRILFSTYSYLRIRTILKNLHNRCTLRAWGLYRLSFLQSSCRAG